MSVFYLGDACSCTRYLFRHRHEEPNCPISIRSLIYVVVFSGPYVGTPGALSDHMLEAALARVAERSKSDISSRSSENAHPLSYIIIWGVKDGELPNFETSMRSSSNLSNPSLWNKDSTRTLRIAIFPIWPEKQRTLHICQLLAILLAHSTDSADVTAVTVHLDSNSTPPVFEFVFSKNKEPVSPHNVERTRVIRDDASKPCQAFIISLCNYMATYFSHIQVHLGMQILKFTSPSLTQLNRMIIPPGPKA